jgi:hypothetical protein
MIFDLLSNRRLLSWVVSVSFCGYVCKTIFVSMCVNNELMRVLIDVNVFRINHDVFRISEELGHLFEWDALRFWEDEVKYQCSRSTNDDEDLPYVSSR